MENCKITFNEKTGIYKAVFTFAGKKYTLENESEVALSNELTEFYTNNAAGRDTDDTEDCPNYNTVE